MSPPGESGCPGPRGDQQEDAGTDAAHVRGRPAADLHADAQGLLPTIPLLQHLQVAPSWRLVHFLRILAPPPLSPWDPAANVNDAQTASSFILQSQKKYPIILPVIHPSLLLTSNLKPINDLQLTPPPLMGSTSCLHLSFSVLCSYKSQRQRIKYKMSHHKFNKTKR